MVVISKDAIGPSDPAEGIYEGMTVDDVNGNVLRSPALSLSAASENSSFLNDEIMDIKLGSVSSHSSEESFSLQISRSNSKATDHEFKCDFDAGELSESIGNSSSENQQQQVKYQIQNEDHSNSDTLEEKERDLNHVNIEFPNVTRQVSSDKIDTQQNQVLENIPKALWNDLKESVATKFGSKNHLIVPEREIDEIEVLRLGTREASATAGKSWAKVRHMMSSWSQKMEQGNGMVLPGQAVTNDNILMVRWNFFLLHV